MELRHLRYFVAVAEAGHFGRAAERLHIAQPPLSRQIQDLEREVGATLFERHARGARLTPAGDMLLSHARAILRGVDAAGEAARRAVRGVVGTLRIGAPDWPVAVRVFTAAVDALREECPELAIEFDAVPWPAHPRALRDRHIDLGFGLTTGGTERGVESVVVGDDPGRYALVAAGHRLACGQRVTPAALAPLPLVIVPRDDTPALHDALVTHLREIGITSPLHARSGTSLSVAAPLVAVGGGWMLVTESVAAEPPYGTVARPVDGLCIPSVFCALVRAGEVGAAAAAFVRHLRSAWARCRTEDALEPDGFSPRAALERVPA